MNSFRTILTYGFTIFAMFFGSGNLVFPLYIGYESGSSWIAGFLGLFLTGIILPFLGLFVIKLYKGSFKRFFGEAGSFAENTIPLFALSLLGSFGVVPRCITVAHGGIGYIFPDVSLFSFALLFSVASYILCLKEAWIVKIIGKIMSPILLVILLILISFGIYFADSKPSTEDAYTSLSIGFFTGYQTMDLFASFFFSSFIFDQIQKSMENARDEEIVPFAIKSSLVGILMLALIYVGFVYLGSHYSQLLDNTKPEHMLPKIVTHVLGSYAGLFLSVAIILSCITTAVALNNIYAQYLCDRLKLSKSFPVMLLITTLVSFLISLLDFSSISAFLAPLLDISYPGLIALTILGIFSRQHRAIKMFLFWSITLLNSFVMIMDI